MTTLLEAHKHDTAYFGERGDWVIVAGTNRDADNLTRANYAAICTWLRDQNIDVEHETSNHWAVGWVEYAVVAPEHTGKADEITERLNDYPVFDDEVYSEFETESVTSAITDAVDQWVYGKTFERNIQPELTASVIEAEHMSDGKDSSAYSGADDYWPTDAFIANVAAELD